ncbi:hydrolase [Paenibacillus athensensis]|uniref:Hydrolase n=1 Tax=Paenibacillus athensensis TaxID=1967502 RepID=A0A4Y8PWJ6_9BACL|nr:HAD family hydrolase [Paenibacillus athensensis]MCD1261477.1 hydrolase [Paenibacillus athensensis]
MIFASDLDQTLIYSSRSMGPDADPALLVPAETLKDQVVSYMYAPALEKLKRLAARLTFIPVTTRTIEQYKRIKLFHEQLTPRYAVTSNGGNVLIGGEADAEWARCVRAKTAKQSAAAAEIRGHFARIAHSDWVMGERFCDELFYAVVIQRDKTPLEAVQELAERARGLGWELSLQGRKLYLIPQCVNKADALRYVRERIGEPTVAAAGDSLLDRVLLDAADYAIAPRHGELFRSFGDDGVYRFTVRSGITAAEEIADYVGSLIWTKEQRDEKGSRVV